MGCNSSDPTIILKQFLLIVKMLDAIQILLSLASIFLSIYAIILEPVDTSEKM